MKKNIIFGLFTSVILLINVGFYCLAKEDKDKKKFETKNIALNEADTEHIHVGAKGQSRCLIFYDPSDMGETAYALYIIKGVIKIEEIGK